MAKTGDTLHDLPQLVAELINRQAPPETVLWIGRPCPRRFHMVGVLHAVFGLAMTIVTLLWFYRWFDYRLPTLSGTEGLFALLALLVTLSGLIPVLMPLFLARKARSTLYVITDYRAILYEGGRKPWLHVVEAADLAHVHCRPRPDGSGDIIIGPDPLPFWIGAAMPKGMWCGMVGVQQVREVERYLSDLAARHEALPQGA